MCQTIDPSVSFFDEIDELGTSALILGKPKTFAAVRMTTLVVKEEPNGIAESDTWDLHDDFENGEVSIFLQVYDHSLVAIDVVAVVELSQDIPEDLCDRLAQNLEMLSCLESDYPWSGSLSGASLTEFLRVFIRQIPDRTRAAIKSNYLQPLEVLDQRLRKSVKTLAELDHQLDDAVAA